MTRELFVYYRVRIDHLDTARDLVAAFHATLTTRHPGLRARLMQREEVGTETPTWMEHYTFDPLPGSRGVTLAIQADIEAMCEPLLSCIDGVRHTEVFIDDLSLGPG